MTKSTQSLRARVLRATKMLSAKQTAAARKSRGQEQQAQAKQTAAARIRSGQERQAATKAAARKRGAGTS
jgi:hypothetical protein